MSGAEDDPPSTPSPEGPEPVIIPAEALLDEASKSPGDPTPDVVATPAAMPESAKPKRRPHWIRRIVIALALFLFVFPPMLTLIYRVVPPPITVLMIERLFQGQGLSKHWRGLGDITPALPQAVIAAEDARFCQHRGFDFQAMREAAAHNERHPGKVRGGSTISQQAAKNVFL